MDALKNGNSELASALLLHHIDQLEADLDLRIKSGPTLSEALEF
jgi:DNA-binding GntR family transcriptional regulator